MSANEERRPAGIWQGRFQVIHKGHYHVFKNALKEYKEKYVAIVNPNPNNYPFDTDECDQFKPYRNPFNYFTRMFLWKKLADQENMDVIFFPCWHAMEYIELENEFLQSKNKRSWIVAKKETTEDAKVRKLREKRGEHVVETDFENEPLEIQNINAFTVREKISKGNYNEAKKSIPECIADLTIDFYNARENNFENVTDNTFLIVPFLNDKIDLTALQFAYEQAKNNDRINIVFIISVPIQNHTSKKTWINRKSENLPWWFKNADTHVKHAKYRIKAEKIIKVMNELQFKII